MGIARLAAAVVVAPLAVLAAAAGSNGPGIASVATNGDAQNGQCYEACVSGNGSVVAFRSSGSNLSPDAPGGGDQIYVRDRKAGTTTLVSDAGEGGFGDSYNPLVSSNGRLVLFQTYVSVLPPDSGGHSDLYLLDRRTGSLALLSTYIDGAVGDYDTFMDGNALSANGRFCAAYGNFTNFPADGLSSLRYQVYHYDFRKGAVTLVSARPDGAAGEASSYAPSVSGNGRWVAFESGSTDLVTGIDQVTTQIYLWDSKKRTLVLVSRANGGGAANEDCHRPVVSNTGTVAFYSGATNLLAQAETDGSDEDVFLFDPRHGGSMTKLSVDAAGTDLSGLALDACISQNGALVAFTSFQPLVPMDVNATRDVYVRDIKKGALRLVSRNAGGAAGNGASLVSATSMAANGHALAFQSEATDVADGDGNGSNRDVLVVDPRK